MYSGVATCADDGDLRVTFDSPQLAVAPGQTMVLYVGEECLGGGMIKERTPIEHNTARHRESEA